MDEKRYFRATDSIKLAYRCWIPVKPKQHIPIVLLHGAASNSTRWWHFIEHSQLAADRYLLRPDLRGHGDSTWRNVAHMENWSQDIATMLKQEHQTQAIIAGHCLGANIALDFASRYPDLCTGLILVEPIAQESVAGILAHLKACLPVLKLTVKLIQLFNRLGLYRRRFTNLDLRELDRRVHEASSEELDKALASHGSPWHDIKTMSIAQYLTNFIELLRPLPVDNINCPCLVIQSSGQSITDPQRTQTVLQGLKNVEFVEIKSEHWIPATHPERLCELIDTWVLNQSQEVKNLPK